MSSFTPKKVRSNRTMVFEFDEVIYPKTDEAGAAINPDTLPIPGVVELLYELKDSHYHIFIYSERASRADEVLAMVKWLERNKIPYNGLGDERPPAIVYFDNDCIRFNDLDNKPLVDRIRRKNLW